MFGATRPRAFHLYPPKYVRILIAGPSSFWKLPFQGPSTWLSPASLCVLLRGSAGDSEGHICFSSHYPRRERSRICKFLVAGAANVRKHGLKATPSSNTRINSCSPDPDFVNAQQTLSPKPREPYRPKIHEYLCAPRQPSPISGP